MVPSACRPHAAWCPGLPCCRATRRRRTARTEEDSEEEAALEDAAEQEEEDEEGYGDEASHPLKPRQRQRHGGGAGQPPAAQQGSAAQWRQQGEQLQQQQQQGRLRQPVGEEESFDEAGDSAVGPLRPSPALRTPPVRRLLPALSPHVAGASRVHGNCLGVLQLHFELC